MVLVFFYALLIFLPKRKCLDEKLKQGGRLGVKFRTQLKNGALPESVIRRVYLFILPIHVNVSSTKKKVDEESIIKHYTAVFSV